MEGKGRGADAYDVGGLLFLGVGTLCRVVLGVCSGTGFF